MTQGYDADSPEFFVLADKEHDVLMGAVGLHTPYVPESTAGELSLGYWLGKPYWEQGFMSEAVPPILKIAFGRPNIKKITAFTDPNNHASQDVLRKTGFRYLGIGPRVEQGCLRGSENVTRWEMTREDYGG